VHGIRGNAFVHERRNGADELGRPSGMDRRAKCLGPNANQEISLADGIGMK
jgi:hypothetical protein